MVEVSQRATAHLEEQLRQGGPDKALRILFRGFG